MLELINSWVIGNIALLFVCIGMGLYHVFFVMGIKDGDEVFNDAYRLWCACKYWFLSVACMGLVIWFSGVMPDVWRLM